MDPAGPVIFVVDDERPVRLALERLLRSMGFRVQAFDTARAFLSSGPCAGPCCLLLDVRMPQMSGLELQAEMAAKGLQMPIIFITGHGSVPVSVRAMKAGAMDFLEKPVEEQRLLEAIGAAIEKDRQSKDARADFLRLQKKAALLTPREYEVFKWVVSGLLNKQIAHELGTSEKTVKVHRARVMEKMEAKSLADLVRMAEKINVFANAVGLKS